MNANEIKALNRSTGFPPAEPRFAATVLPRRTALSAEMEAIWRQGWLFAGHSCQIPSPATTSCMTWKAIRSSSCVVTMVR